MESEEEKTTVIREDDGQRTIKAQNKPTIQLLSIIGEVEGHEALGAGIKTTKYEHVLPALAAVQEDENIKGLLVILHTMGGDVEAGLAIAEMIASLGKPTVSLVLGGSHSIGVPIAVSCDASFIVPTGTMVIHPVRITGCVICAEQSYDFFRLMQDRINDFICKHSKIKRDVLEELMMKTGVLTKDIGSILVGKEAVKKGLVDRVGGINQAFDKLYELIRLNNKK